jgi:tetratricopeptide (TPR) repeat protein
VHGKIVGFEKLAATGLGAQRGPEWQPRPVRAKSPYEQEPRKWRTNGAGREHQREGWRLAERKDVPGAIRHFELALAECGDDPVTRAALAELHGRNGRPAEMAVHLQWLEDSWRRDQGYWTGSCLARALSECGRSQDALETAKAVLARFPDDEGTWRVRAQSELFLGLVDDANRSIERAIELGPHPWAYYWRHKIHFLGRRDVDEAIRSVLQAYVVFNDARRASDDLRAIEKSGGGPRLRPVLTAFDCAPDVRARLATILDEVAVGSDGSGAARVLTAHLRRIAGMAVAAGAVPVFLSYPMPMPAEEVLREVAAGVGVHFLGVSAEFQRRLPPRSWEDVRAPDGHCNDEGYRLMAECIAEGLRDVIPAAGR